MDFNLLFSDTPKTVLFGVLNWGLGHASRSLCLIKYLEQSQSTVIIASDGAALKFLKKECPDSHFETLPTYNITYNHQSIELSLLKQSKGILSAILKENHRLKRLIKKHQADLIISDSRFGFYSKSVKSIIISHQLTLLSEKPLFSFIGNKMNRLFLNKFVECWVPDYKDQRLSGRLSDNHLRIPVKYIGPLSRFQKKNIKTTNDIFVILSGPEPARSKLEQILKSLLVGKDFTLVAVAGRVDSRQLQDSDGWYNYFLSEEVETSLIKSKLVICRSGYSSIMDLDALNKQAILIPTPGQSEQVYLAHHLKNNDDFICLEESELEQKLIQNITFNLK